MILKKRGTGYVFMLPPRPEPDESRIRLCGYSQCVKTLVLKKQESEQMSKMKKLQVITSRVHRTCSTTSPSTKCPFFSRQVAKHCRILVHEIFHE